jgi:hypothetical protein
MKRFAMCVIAMTVAASAHAAAFSDTASTAFDANIATLKASGAVNGYADGTFKPNALINRAEFVKILIAFLGNSPAEPKGCFGDFNPDLPQWYYGYACAAKQAGYIGGYPDGSFGGEKNINLAEALKIVMKANGTSVSASTGAWYEPFLMKAETLGMFAKLKKDPSHSLTRGEMAYLVSFFAQQEEQNEEPVPEEPNETQTPILKANTEDHTITFTNDKYGYTVTFPDTWDIDTTNSFSSYGDFGGDKRGGTTYFADFDEPAKYSFDKPAPLDRMHLILRVFQTDESIADFAKARRFPTTQYATTKSNGMAMIQLSDAQIGASGTVHTFLQGDGKIFMFTYRGANVDIPSSIAYKSEDAYKWIIRSFRQL